MTDPTPTTAKKLYAVRVEYQAYVLAESIADAEDFAARRRIHDLHEILSGCDGHAGKGRLVCTRNDITPF